MSMTLPKDTSVFRGWYLFDSKGKTLAQTVSDAVKLEEDNTGVWLTTTKKAAEKYVKFSPKLVCEYTITHEIQLLDIRTSGNLSDFIKSCNETYLTESVSIEGFTNCPRKVVLESLKEKIARNSNYTPNLGEDLVFIQCFNNNKHEYDGFIRATFSASNGGEVVEEYYITTNALKLKMITSEV